MAPSLTGFAVFLAKSLLLTVVGYLFFTTVRACCCFAFITVNPHKEGSFPFNAVYQHEIRECIARY